VVWSGPKSSPSIEELRQPCARAIDLLLVGALHSQMLASSWRARCADQDRAALIRRQQRRT
jgi:hypothetical protein